VTTPVSVVLYVHNGARYLRAAIESILAQHHDAFELCVVDDGSTDATASILAELGADERVRVEHQEALGRDRLHETFNHCLAMARHDLIAVANADDLWLPDKLGTQIALLDREPATDVCWHDATFMDANGRITLGGFRRTPSGTLHRNLRARDFVTGDPIPNPTTMFRRDVLHVVGLQEVGWMHDYQFWFKAAARRCEFVGLPDRLLRYRIHEESHSTSSRRIERIRTERRTVATDMINRVGLASLYPELALTGRDDRDATGFAMMHLAGLCWLALLPDLAVSWWERALAECANPAAIHNLAIAHLVDDDAAEGRRLLRQAHQAGVAASGLALDRLSAAKPVIGLLDWHGPKPTIAAMLDDLPTRIPQPARPQLPAADELLTVTADWSYDDVVLALLSTNGDPTVILTDDPDRTALVATAYDAIGDQVGAAALELLEVQPEELASVIAAHTSLRHPHLTR
jgi:hypothetical protein